MLAVIMIAAGTMSPMASAAQPSAPTDSAISQRDWLPFPVPEFAYAKWRKHGEWDFRQLGSRYRSDTFFNFGATAKAAGLTAQQVQDLVRAARPMPNDVKSLEDPRLISNFHEHSKEFESLRRMADDDLHVLRIARDYTNVDEYLQQRGEKIGLDTDRWNRYRESFATLHIPDGLVRTEDFPGAIFFIFRAKGLCTAGTSSGYVYSPAPVAPIVTSPAASLDALARKRTQGEALYVFVPLGGNWYAFYELDG